MYSINDALDKPRVGVALAEHAVRGAIAHVYVPLVAVPVFLVPPSARRTPGPGTPCDPPPVQSSAVGGDVRRPVAFDTHPRRDRQPEPAEREHRICGTVYLHGTPRH